MQEDDRDILRVGIVVGGVKSSVSMDGRLAFYLGEKIGGEDRVRGWVRDTVRSLEKKWEEAASTAAIGDRVRANTGLSRAIQREALDELMRGIVLYEQPNNGAN